MRLNFWSYHVKVEEFLQQNIGHLYWLNGFWQVCFFNRSMPGFLGRFVILVEKSWDQWNGLYTPAKTHFLRVEISVLWSLSSTVGSALMMSCFILNKKSTCVTTFAPIKVFLFIRYIIDHFVSTFKMSSLPVQNYPELLPKLSYLKVFASSNLS